MGARGSITECRLERAGSRRVPEALQPALEGFIKRFGAERPVGIARVPGRLNVLGMHIDHRGGYVNPMALGREVVLVFSPADDDTVDVVNLDEALGRRTFHIAEVKPPRKVSCTEAWLDWTQRLSQARVESGGAHDWTHKLAAPGVYLSQFAFPDRPIRGLVGVMTGNIPPRVGLSSSSAVVVGMMLATMAVNCISVSREELVEHCGVAEWYVGTRGGFGDHAAIVCSRAGQLVHLRTVPELKIAGYVPFAKAYRLLVFHSGHDADKTGAAGNLFNERTATYEMAELLAARFLRERHTSLWQEMSEAHKTLANPKPLHLGDIAERLTSAEIYQLLASIPEQADRKEVKGMLSAESEAIARQFATHREPTEGYRLRGVLLYGIAECARAIRGGELLRRGDIDGFGRLMRLSHDGDRVSGIDGKLAALKRGLDTTLDISEQPGDYACSTPEIDAMVDIALEAGAVGAQVSGAGLGGSMMALIEAAREDDLVRAMRREYYTPRGIEPNYLPAVPSAGATLL